MIRHSRFIERHRGKIRPFLLVAPIWAIICAGFTYDAVQRERQRLYESYVVQMGKESTITISPPLLDAKIEALEEKFEQTHRQELRELYWIFAPFLWGCIVFSGLVIAAGFILPINWRKSSSK
jgi:hypothetical protein